MLISSAYSTHECVKMNIFGDAHYGNTPAFNSQFEMRLAKSGFNVSSVAPDKIIPEPDDRSGQQLESVDTFIRSVYNELSIIDNKVGSLTQVSSVLLVLSGLSASTIFGWRGGNDTEIVASVFQSYAITCSLIFLSLALVLSLSVIWLHWFPELNARAPEGELRKLLLVRNKRTRRYRLSWLFTFAGLIFALGNLLFEAQRI